MLDQAGVGQRVNVGIGEFVLSTNSSDIIMAPNLGSCLGVAIYDPASKVGGVIHCLLPNSASDPAKAKEKPALYVDTGITMLIEKILKMGAQKKNLLIGATGAGNINDDKNIFEIGKKNHTIFRKLMWKNGLLIKGEHVGNPHSTTLILTMATGEATVKSISGGIVRLF